MRESEDQATILPPSSGIFAPVFRQDVAKEMEVQVMADTSKAKESVVFQQDEDEEDMEEEEEE